MTVPPASHSRGQPIVSREEQKKPYVELAEGMETQFASHMIEQMRRTIPRDEEPSSAQRYYESLMDQEHAQALAKSDTGLGLKRVVLEQILPAHLKDAHASYQRNAAAPIKGNVKGVDE